MPMKRLTSGGVVWLLTICTALALLGDATLYVVLPSTYASLDLALWQVGWLLSINRLARIPLNLFSGALADRIGSRTPFIIGLTLGALSTLGYALLEGFWLLLAMRVLWGISWALLVVAAYGLILNTVGEQERGRWTGFYASGSFFGGAIGAMLGGYLIDALGLRQGMLILGLLTVLGALLACAVPRVSPQPRPATPARPANMSPQRAMLLAASHQIRRFDARLWLILALNLAHRFFFAGIFYATFGLYLRQRLGDGLSLGVWFIGIASLTGTLLFVRNLLTMLVGPLVGWISDLLGDRVRTLLVGEVCGALALLALALGQATWVLGVGVILAAVAYGIVPPMLVSWLGDLCPADLRGRAVGAYQLSGDLGSGLGPLVVYGLVTTMGLAPVYGLCGALLLCAVPLILWVQRRQRLLFDVMQKEY